MARGSLSETLDHIIVAFDETYISIDKMEEFKKLHDKTQKILNGYIKYLMDSKYDKQKLSNTITE